MNSTTKGVIYIALGASSYGMLASIVKIAYQNGYTTAEVTSAQFFLGIFYLLILQSILSKKTAKATFKDKRQLYIAGTTMGFTSVLYYLAVKYIDASIAVVLLMQSVWMGVVIEALLSKKFPSGLKIASVLLILAGTALATNMIENLSNIHPKGIFFGFLAALSFTLFLLTSNRIASHLPTVKRSFFMLLGGATIILIFAFFTQIAPHYLNLSLAPEEFTTNKAINFEIFYTLGIILSLFGTVIPPLLLNQGFPLTGLGLGSIVSSLELPISVCFAFVLLNEKVLWSQWLGIAIILGAIVLMNYKLILKKTA